MVLLETSLKSLYIAVAFESAAVLLVFRTMILTFGEYGFISPDTILLYSKPGNGVNVMSFVAFEAKPWKWISVFTVPIPAVCRYVPRSER